MMTDSRDSEMENSASERARYKSSEIPESEIPRIGFMTGTTLRFHTEEENKSNACKLNMSTEAEIHHAWIHAFGTVR